MTAVIFPAMIRGRKIATDGLIAGKLLCQFKDTKHWPEKL